jgi:hypothetical protein
MEFVLYMFLTGALDEDEQSALYCGHFALGSCYVAWWALKALW